MFSESGDISDPGIFMVFFEDNSSKKYLNDISKEKNPRAIARFLFNTISGLRVAVKSGVKRDIYNDIVSVALEVIK